MNKTFWVTLRNIPADLYNNALAWMREHEITPYGINHGELAALREIFPYVSYSFTNDDDAMLFKLRWSDYL
jgi:hypothetical protein